MSYKHKDKTLADDNKRELSFTDQHMVERILPEYFTEQFPTLISFLKAYYEYEDGPDAPSRLIHSLFNTRDISSTDLSLLSLIEDELLLGQQYFEGFKNKRVAAKFSNNLYRSKGTLYSIQQFFRSFFGIYPDIVYTKKNIFTVGESVIGPQSERFLHDDKLYQKYALLVKADLPLIKWKEAYKLFVHPAGMYLGAELQIVTASLLNDNYAPDANPPISLDPLIIAEPLFGIVPQALGEVTGLVYMRDGKPAAGQNATLYRIDPTIEPSNVGDKTIEELDREFDTVAEYYGITSPTFDEDDVVGDTRTPRFSNIDDTFDQVTVDVY